MATQDLTPQSDLLNSASAQGQAIRIYHRHLEHRWVWVVLSLLGVTALLFFGAISILDGLPPDLLTVVIVLGLTIPAMYLLLRKVVITIDPPHSRITRDKRLFWYHRKSTWAIDTFSVIKLTTTISDGSTSYDVTLFGPESAAVNLMKQDIFAKDILTVLHTLNEAQATASAIDLSTFLNLPAVRREVMNLRVQSEAPLQTP